ncbi:MAG: hypothetical protein ACFFCL_15200 [Promethearchaeota archaeon]
MNKKKKNSNIEGPHPKIIEIEEQEIEERKPPTDKINYYKIVNNNDNS